jgi:hypothetical protein
VLELVKKGNFDFDKLEGLMRKETWQTTSHLPSRAKNKSVKTER